MAGQARVDAVIQQQLDDPKIVVATERVVQRRITPSGHQIGIGAVLEEQLDAFAIVPVVLAKKKRGEAVAGQLACADEQLQHLVVVRFGVW